MGKRTITLEANYQVAPYVMVKVGSEFLIDDLPGEQQDKDLATAMDQLNRWGHRAACDHPAHKP